MTVSDRVCNNKRRGQLTGLISELLVFFYIHYQLPGFISKRDEGLTAIAFSINLTHKP